MPHQAAASSSSATPGDPPAESAPANDALTTSVEADSLIDLNPEETVPRFADSLILLEGDALAEGPMNGSTAASSKLRPSRPFDAVSGEAEHFIGEWDDEGVFVYQAFCDEIAEWALKHQKFGGPKFCPKRMTWIKPSFAWMLYRSGYGHKHGQHRVLKVKLAHSSIAEILSHCQCIDTNKATRKGGAEKDRDISSGVVQWDPVRDLMMADEKGKEPRKCLRDRAIQIWLKGWMSELYVKSVLSIQDVTELAHRVGQAHGAKKKGATALMMVAMLPELPAERPYMPGCSESQLVALALLPGEQSAAVARLGRGKAA